MTKRLTAILLSLCLILGAAFIVSAQEGEPTLNPDAYPRFADKGWGALYAHATLGGNSPQAWQRWGKDYTGLNAQRSVRYFFLPNTADDSRVEIYNNYDNTATIGGVSIEPYTSAVIPYKDGEIMTAEVNDRTYSFTVLKSDSEASVYVNDTKNSYTDVNGVVQETDLYSFLIQNKENSVKGSDCAIASGSDVKDTTLKKIKGRGNTNWTQSDKKPFNLQFSDMTTIGHTTSKKFSFVSNAKDSTLLRNTLMYNLANDTGSPYAPDQSFVDFFVNGEYRGSFIACQKIDMGKNSVVSLKDTSDKATSDFNFLVEVDVWNYKSDVFFVTDRGYHVVLKTPDLEGYDETDEEMKARYDYIKDTFQKLEDALYAGNLEELEKICDLDSLASQYLLQEFGKNCDGGYTSTYFTYNAEKGKFFAAPIWDCDSDLGAVDCVRDGCSTSTCDYRGWITKTATYKSEDKQVTVNPLGQAFNLTGEDSEGLDFESRVKKLWSERFLPKISVMLGYTKADDGRLKSIDDYAKSIEKSSYNNYVMWGFMWYCARYNSGLEKKYSADLEGELSYLKDWTKARADWMTAQFNKVQGYNTIYFADTENWGNISYYAWANKNTPMKWPGESAQLVETTDAGVKIYKATVPDELDRIIFNGGMEAPQTVDISITPEYNLYSPSTPTGRENSMYYPIYNVSQTNYTEPEKPTETQTETPTETQTETQTEAQTETPTETQTETQAEPEPIRGDSNLDGKVNIKDATAIQKCAANIITFSDRQKKALGLRPEDEVTVKHATNLQKYLAGIITVF
ncbi:MAG: CotH kinase family protein [Ruminococcus sp.]|nr:CotH kinase family protein [Ruminococcus sp.]